MSRKKITEVGNKIKGRKLRIFKNKVQCALWFSVSFGLELSQVKFNDEKEGTHLLNWETSFESLGEEDNKKTEQILFLLDKFCVGDEVYELTMYMDDLPKSYLITQLRSNLNKTYTVTRQVDHEIRRNCCCGIRVIRIVSGLSVFFEVFTKHAFSFFDVLFCISYILCLNCCNQLFSVLYVMLSPF